MSSANGDPRDLESIVYVPTISSFDEKQPLRTEAGSMSKKMSRLQHAIFTLLLVSLFSVGVFGAVWNNKSLHNAVHRISPEESRFQELLNSVDPSALHDVLHGKKKDKYQHDMFHEDKIAVEALHQRNAVEAESLIELAKRQAASSGNGTVVTTTDVTTTQTIVTSTESITSTADLTTSPTPTTSSSQSSTTTPSSQQSTSTSEFSTSTFPSSTTTNVSTTSSTSTTTSSSSVSTTFSTSPTSTSQGSSTQTQSGSESGTQTAPMSSRTTIYTTTIPNGAVTTVTSVTVVPAGQADQTTGTTAPTASGSATLQKGGVGRMEIRLGGLSVVVGGAVMVVMGVL